MKDTALFKEFKNSLKDPWAEELADLFFFRPIAFLLVKVLRLAPITPNQISFLAMASGITAGVLFTGGNRTGFLLGAFFYGFANILDCCDGMIARLKKNGTMTGRIVDGCTDYIIGIAVYSGFAVGLSKAVHSYGMHLPANSWILMLLAAISFAVHAVMSDKYRNAYLLQKRQTDRAPENEFEKFQGELKRLEGLGDHVFDKWLIRIYLRYLRIQSGDRKQPRTQAVSARAMTVNSASVVLWNLIGPSTHVVFLIVSTILYNPTPFFIYVIAAANLWMSLLLLLPNRHAESK